MFHLTVYQGRTKDFSVSLKQVNGSAFGLAVDDVVRLKVGRTGDEPLIDISSIAPTANGSSLAFTTGDSIVAIRFGGSDLAAIPGGSYDIEVGVVDNSETSPADAFKLAAIGVLSVIQTLGGETEDEESSSSGDSESSSSSLSVSESSSSSQSIP